MESYWIGKESLRLWRQLASEEVDDLDNEADSDLQGLYCALFSS